jgi:hypothetical protein
MIPIAEVSYLNAASLTIKAASVSFLVRVTRIIAASAIFLSTERDLLPPGGRLCGSARTMTDGAHPIAWFLAVEALPAGRGRRGS